MLTPDDLLQPIGRLTPAMFPKLKTAPEVQDALQVYLDEGYVKAAALEVGDVQDAAVRRWAEYRTFSGFADHLAATAASASLQGLGSMGISSSQYAYYAGLAAAALAEFENATATAPVRVPIQGSAAARTIVRF